MKSLFLLDSLLFIDVDLYAVDELLVKFLVSASFGLESFDLKMSLVFFFSVFMRVHSNAFTVVKRNT